MKTHSPRFLAIIEDAKSRIKETDVPTTLQRLTKDASFHLIDVREESEWSRGHLPRAIHLGKGVLERDIEKQVPNLDDEIILYCGGGFRSALAAENLGRMGYTNVLSMDGGYREWTTSGHPVETETP
jgi:rhodanese-related sulfurtransferase